MSESNQDQSPKRWESKTYELLNFQLTDAFVAVFGELAADGFTDLHSYPIQAIGLAKVTTQFLECWPGGKPWEYKPAEAENAIVGLNLNDGYWHIAQECENFAGIAGVHDDIREATGELNCMKYRKLRCSQG
jgi:hypothetical protein